MHALAGAAGVDGFGVGIELGLHRCGIVHGLSERGDFSQLLLGEGEPLFQLVVQLGFGGHVDRRMQQRAAGGNDDAVTAEGCFSFVQQLKRFGEIVLPDVAAIDHAERQMLLGLDGFQRGVELLRLAHQVDMHGLGTKAEGQVGVVAQAGEVGGQRDFQAGFVQHLEGRFVGGFLRRGEVERQAWLIDLHPFGAGIFQRGEQALVDRQQFRQQADGILAALHFADAEIGDGADDYRAGCHALQLGFVEMFNDGGEAQVELRLIRKFGDDVVVVGIEPFGHFAGDDIDTVFLVAAGHGEIEGQRVGLQRVVAGGDGAEHQRMVEHLIVQREVAAGDGGDASVFLALPVFSADGFGGGEQVSLRGFALPVALLSFFEFAVRADAGEAEVSSASHFVSPIRMVVPKLGVVV